MTRKTAPRAPVCGSDTLGGCKDATPGLREQTEGKREREDEQLDTAKGKKESDVHSYRPCVDLQESHSMCLNNEELLNHPSEFLNFYFFNFLFNFVLYILYTVKKANAPYVNSANTLFRLLMFTAKI